MIIYCEDLISVTYAVSDDVWLRCSVTRIDPCRCYVTREMLKFSCCVIRFVVRTIVLWPLTILHAYGLCVCSVLTLLKCSFNVVL